MNFVYRAVHCSCMSFDRIVSSNIYIVYWSPHLADDQFVFHIHTIQFIQFSLALALARCLFSLNFYNVVCTICVPYWIDFSVHFPSTQPHTHTLARSSFFDRSLWVSFDVHLHTQSLARSFAQLTAVFTSFSIVWFMQIFFIHFIFISNFQIWNFNCSRSGCIQKSSNFNNCVDSPFFISIRGGVVVFFLVIRLVLCIYHGYCRYK